MPPRALPRTLPKSAPSPSPTFKPGRSYPEQQRAAAHLPKLPILYDDAAVVAVDKPYGLVSQAGKTDALSIEDYLPGLNTSYGLPPPHPLHRLDRSTTGVLLLSRNPSAASTLSRQFRQHTIQKTYLALAQRSASPRRTQDTEGLCRAPLRVGAEGRVRVLEDKKDKGESDVAETEWKELGHHPELNLSLLLLRPKTGRKHQLRAHCAHLGLPILGDRLHGIAALTPALRALHKKSDKQIFLHARELAFQRWEKTPQGKAKMRWISVKAPIPKAWRPLLERAGFMGFEELQEDWGSAETKVVEGEVVGELD